VTAPRASLLERRRELVRADLARVAIALFAERGFDAVTVDDIAAVAGTSQRTFFRYFATKDEVVLEYERHLWRRLLAAFDERPVTEGAITALREAFRSTSHVEEGDRADVVRLGRILESAPSLQARADGERVAERRALAEGVAARMGVGVDDARPRVVVAAMTAVADSEFRTWTREGGKDDPAQRIATALALVENGLADLDRPRRRSAKRVS
jgi:AcrR family transcriptional regulator